LPERRRQQVARRLTGRGSLSRNASRAACPWATCR
jgi:hypothetical protein